MERRALAIFSVRRLVLENALGGIIRSLFGTFTNNRANRAVRIPVIASTYSGRLRPPVPVDRVQHDGTIG